MNGVKYELGINENENNYSEFSELHTELLFYLEDKIKYGIASDSEILLYNEFKILSTIDFESIQCKKLIEEMEREYLGNCEL